MRKNSGSQPDRGLGVGSHTIQAVYRGADGVLPSTSAASTLTVTLFPTQHDRLAPTGNNQPDGAPPTPSGVSQTPAPPTAPGGNDQPNPTPTGHGQPDTTQPVTPAANPNTQLLDAVFQRAQLFLLGLGLHPVGEGV